MPSSGNIRGPRALGLISQILLAVQLLSLGHLLAAHHVTCPEHGDIVHVSRAPALAPVAVRPNGVTHDATLGAPAGADDEHDQCQVCVDQGRRFAGLRLPLHGLPHHQVGVAQAHPVAFATCATLDLILLSPKNSPPTA